MALWMVHLSVVYFTDLTSKLAVLVLSSLNILVLSIEYRLTRGPNADRVYHTACQVSQMVYKSQTFCILLMQFSHSFVCVCSLCKTPKKENAGMLAQGSSVYSTWSVACFDLSWTNSVGMPMGLFFANLTVAQIEGESLNIMSISSRLRPIVSG